MTQIRPLYTLAVSSHLDFVLKLKTHRHMYYQVIYLAQMVTAGVAIPSSLAGDLTVVTRTCWLL